MLFSYTLGPNAPFHHFGAHFKTNTKENRVHLKSFMKQNQLAVVLYHLWLHAT